MTSAYQLVVFDWEGTLADTIGPILRTVAKVAKNLGFGDFAESEGYHYIDWGLERAVKKVFPHLNASEHEQLLQSVQAALVANGCGSSLMPGAAEFLAKLQDLQIQMAVASNKGRVSLERALQTASLTKVFSITRTAEETAPKPYPQMLEEIMDYCGVEAAETVMIGDSSIDMEMAKALGVCAIGFDFYRQQENTLLAAGAQAVFTNYQQVADYILS